MEDADSGTQRARVLRVATRCTTADQFVEAFARFCDGRTLFVSSLSTRPIGTRLPFVILLADGTRAMRGQCEVIESHANPNNVYRRPGVKLSLIDLDDHSEAMLGRLQVARAARDARTSPQPASAVAIELPPDASKASIAPVPSGPPPPPGAPGHGAVPPPPPPPPRAPGRAAAGGRQALPPLPKLSAEVRRETPATGAPTTEAAPAAAGHWLAPQAGPLPVRDGAVTPGDTGGNPRRLRGAESGELQDRPRAPVPPPPTDATDAGWGDDDGRPPRAPTAPPVAAEPPDDDSSPAVIVAAAPDPAAAAVVAAAGDAMDAVPVVELINRSHGGRRDTGRNPSGRATTASGALAGSGRVSAQFSAARMRSTPGDVYSGEERTPGSAFILPANPLSNLTDESLQGFIDCTIYEDNSQLDPARSDPAISGSQLGMVEEDSEPDFRAFAPAEPPPPVFAPPPRARSTSGMRAVSEPHPAPAVEPVRPRAVSQSMASIDEDEDEDDLLPPAAVPVAAEPAVARTRPPRPTPPPPLPPPRSARPSGSSAPDWMATASGQLPRQGTKPPPRPKPAPWLRPWLLVLLVLLVAGAVYLRYRDRLRPDAAPTRGSGVARDAAVAAVGVVRDAAVAAVVVDAGAGSGSDAMAVRAVDAAVAPPAIDAALVEVPTGTCRLQVTTTPGGAAVSLGNRNLGASPVEVEVACGTATLSARLAKYRTASRPVTIGPGAPAVYKLKLARPNHNLTVLSTPRGAVVMIDGRPAGITPLTVEVSGFTRHVVTIEAKGYQIHRTSVTTDDVEQTVAVPLIKLP